MIGNPGVHKILFGGDYNPEQWTPDIWEEDMRYFKKAGIDIVTLNVFNWAMLQPDEETYDFSALDDTVARVTENGMQICMANSTAAHPAWMARKYPDVLRTEFNGMRRKFGGRHNSCPNSPSFRRFALRLTEELAEHYKDQKNIAAWHVSNEYGGACYCENCEKAFRVWLKRKYKTLDKLNHEWNTHFWGKTYYSWDDIVVPNLLSEHFEEKRSQNQGLTLDYMRFNSDSMLENFKAERDAIKARIPGALVTTNMMGFYKQLDYKKWAGEMDFVSWDNYPNNEDPGAMVAMRHELTRGLKQGMPFALMEQTPSVSNWLTDNSLKRPGVLRMQSYQAVAHGADTVMFFQMRRSPASCEKFHGAVIDHSGTDNTRVFRECAAIGKELQIIGDKLLGTRTHAKAAVMFDWDNWWALECSAGPNNRLGYVKEVFRYYQALFEKNIPADIIGPDDDYSKYSLIVAPVLYVIKPGTDDKFRKFTEEGGTALFTFLSGLVNENDYITLGGYPGKLRELCGVWVEEFDSLGPDAVNHFTYQGVRYPAGMICDLMHPEGAAALACYEEDFYAGMPVVCRNSFGKGRVYYIGTSSNQEFYDALLGDISKECGLVSALEGQEEASVKEIGLEAARRENEDYAYTFLLNREGTEKELVMPLDGVDILSGEVCRKGDRLKFAPYDVHIIESKK